MVMLKIVSAPISIPFFRHLHMQVLFFLQYSRHVSFGMAIPPTAGFRNRQSLGICRFFYYINFHRR